METKFVKLSKDINKSEPLLKECIELFDSVEAYDYPRFRSNINDIWGTVDFDPFNGKTVVMDNIKDWEKFYSNAIHQASNSGLSVWLNIDRYNGENSRDNTLAWSEVRGTQHMIEKSGNPLHIWTFACTIVWYFDKGMNRWIERRYHASLQGDFGIPISFKFRSKIPVIWSVLKNKLLGK